MLQLRILAPNKMTEEVVRILETPAAEPPTHIIPRAIASPEGHNPSPPLLQRPPKNPPTNTPF